MSISSVSIRNPVFSWMIMASLIIFGGISFLRMGISLNPDVDFPVISVTLTLEGAAPEVMETDVVDVVEDAVMGIEGVRHVNSTARTGVASVIIEFELSRNIDLALQDVQSRIAQAQRRLPREMDPPTIMKINAEDQPILWLAVQSKAVPLRDLLIYVRDDLKDKFATVPGVGEVFLGGYVDPNMRIWVDDKKLSAYNLTVNDLIETVRSEHREPPAGEIDTPLKQYNVRTLGEATNPEEFARLVINQRGGSPNFRPLRMGEVAKMEAGLADIRRISRADGITAIGLGIRKQRGSNAVEVAHAVKARMREVEARLPKGVELTVNYDGTKFIEQSVRELNFTLLLAAMLTALICWLFLGSWSSTLNVILAIPTSIVGSFIILYFAGFTLNLMTLLALSLSIGIVVDDAIMVLENIIRHREKGKGRVEAALVGSREITFAALAATVAIVAIFLPVAFMKGIIGRFFFQFGVTITVAVLLSLLEALTLTPMRCSQFVEAGGERRTHLGRWFEIGFNASRAFYGRTLAIALRHRVLTLLGALLFFAASFSCIGWLNKEFSPSQDISIFLLRGETPVGSSIQYTSSRFQEIEEFLAGRKEVRSYYVAVGGFVGGEVNTGMSFISLKDKGQRGIDPTLGREITMQELMAVMRQRFGNRPDFKVTLQDLSQGGFDIGHGFPVEVTIQGPDWDSLALYARQIMEEMKKTGLHMDVDTDYKVGMPEIQVRPDRVKASAHGVSVASIGETVNAMIGGLLVGRYPEGGHRYDVRVKLQEDQRDPMSRVRSLYVRNNRGEMVPLADVVNLLEKPTLQTINRHDRERAVAVFANVQEGKSQRDAMKAAEEIAKKVLPPGYHLANSGSAETFKESFQSLIFALILGLIVSYMVLASQFNSYIDPFTVLMALPFSFSGAFLALLLAGHSINIYSMIGLILLMGIVKKNSILLVDFTNQIRARGETNIHQALQKACPIRFRPIIMTSVSTIVGALPAALSLGPGAETRSPMAVAVIGGLFVSTLLTLYVVPVTYSLLSKLERRRLTIAEVPGTEVKTLRGAADELVSSDSEAESSPAAKRRG